MTKLIAGIDPGFTGAIAFVDTNGVLADVVDMPITGDNKHRRVSAVLVRNSLFEHGTDEVVIEAVGAMPGNGAQSMFKFGRAVGVVEGAAADMPTFFLSPQSWKKTNGLLRRDKDAARGLALERWPDMADLFARKRDIGRADAALIAWAHIDGEAGQ